MRMAISVLATALAVAPFAATPHPRRTKLTSWRL